MNAFLKRLYRFLRRKYRICKSKYNEKSIKRKRDLYYKFLRMKLKNKSPTIIASDCFGSFVYHNLGLQFRSPTINLFFTKKDFWIFVNNLEVFLKADVTEVKDTSVNYPVGKIVADGQEIFVNFMHYNSFAYAKEKWDERKKRVSLDNIYIIQLIENATEQDIECFGLLPYKNKMLITGKNINNCEYVVEHPVLLTDGYQHGDILTYPSRSSVKRYMDDIDYVSFLNQLT